MTRTPDDIWRFPSLDTLGTELSSLESTERKRGYRRRILAAAPVAVAAVVALVLVLPGKPAGALSTINQAPAAAIRSRTVQFASAIDITRGGRLIRRFQQGGEADFAARRYRTALTAASNAEGLELRSVAGILYAAQTRGPQRAARARRWLAVRLSPHQRAALAAAPEADAVTDPLRILQKLRTPVSRVGRATIDGTRTTAYRATTSMDALLRASGFVHLPPVDRHVGADVTVWLDAAGRPRRVKEVLTGSSAAGAVSLVMVMNMSGYGRPVTIQAPASVAAFRALRSGPPRPLAGAPTRIFESLL